MFGEAAILEAKWATVGCGRGGLARPRRRVWAVWEAYLLSHRLRQRLTHDCVVEIWEEECVEVADLNGARLTAALKGI